MSSDIDHLLALSSGDSDSSRWMAGVLSKLQRGISWNQATRMTPCKVANGIRDKHLACARELVTSSSELFRQARRFESIVWPRWRMLDMPPENANALHRSLFLARKAGKFPDSIRQLTRVTGHK
jgi:hypothetical protein